MITQSGTDVDVFEGASCFEISIALLFGVRRPVAAFLSGSVIWNSSEQSADRSAHSKELRYFGSVLIWSAPAERSGDGALD